MPTKAGFTNPTIKIRQKEKVKGKCIIRRKIVESLTMRGEH